MALHTEYRPKTFNEFLLSSTSVALLKKILTNDNVDFSKIPHTYLLTGKQGCGKTTLAKIIADTLGCEKTIAFFEYNASSLRGIDTVRGVIDKSKHKPFKGSCNMFFFDEAHQLTKEAQEALLALIEEPREFNFYIFATTEPQSFKPTFLDRCFKVEVKPLSEKKLIRLLKKVMDKSGIENPLIEKYFDEIYEYSEGRPRTALVLLEALKECETDEQVKDILDDYMSFENKDVIMLCRALLKKDSWKNIASILKDLDMEPEGVRKVVLSYFNKVMLSRPDPHVAGIIEAFMDNFYDSGQAGLTLACYLSIQ